MQTGSKTRLDERDNELPGTGAQESSDEPPPPQADVMFDTDRNLLLPRVLSKEEFGCLAACFLTPLANVTVWSVGEQGRTSFADD